MTAQFHTPAKMQLLYSRSVTLLISKTELIVILCYVVLQTNVRRTGVKQ